MHRPYNIKFGITYIVTRILSVFHIGLIEHYGLTESIAAPLGFRDISKESVAFIFKVPRSMKNRHSIKTVNP
jgi:hypothetical protein